MPFSTAAATFSFLPKQEAEVAVVTTSYYQYYRLSQHYRLSGNYQFDTCLFDDFCH